MGSFHKAERRRAKARIALCGPSGSGKTYSAILLAKGFGGRCAMIDTENGSGELYSHLHDYDVATLEGDFSPLNYIKLIHEAEDAGYDIIIIDSLTHAWEGQGGTLEKHSLKTDEIRNSFMAWGKIIPKYYKPLVNTILQSPAHIIGTIRSKTHYAVVEEVSGNGKTIIRPTKVGLKPIQKEELEYEFTFMFNIARDGHLATVSKDRTSLFEEPQVITEETGRTIINYLNSGVEDTNPQPKSPRVIIPEPAQPAAVPSLKVQFDAEIRKWQETVNERLIDANYAPLTDVQKYRVEIGQWIRQTPFGQLTPELLEWIRNDDEAFVQDFSTFILSKQPAEAAV